MVLSSKQMAAALNAAAVVLDQKADVSRGGTETRTPTGWAKADATVYSQIDCHVAPISQSSPTARDSDENSDLFIEGYAWFPAELSGTPTAFMLGDIIEVAGQTWRATTDQDPDQGNARLRRVRVNRPHKPVEN